MCTGVCGHGLRATHRYLLYTDAHITSHVGSGSSPRLFSAVLRKGGFLWHSSQPLQVSWEGGGWWSCQSLFSTQVLSAYWLLARLTSLAIAFWVAQGQRLSATCWRCLELHHYYGVFFIQVFGRPPMCQALCWTMGIQQWPKSLCSHGTWYGVVIYCTHWRFMKRGPGTVLGVWRRAWLE